MEIPQILEHLFMKLLKKDGLLGICISGRQPNWHIDASDKTKKGWITIVIQPSLSFYYKAQRGLITYFLVLFFPLMFVIQKKSICL